MKKKFGKTDHRILKSTLRRVCIRSKSKPASLQSTVQQIGGWLAFGLALATIILFASGQGYREGYLAGFSVDIAQVPVGFHETLYWGYLVNAKDFILFFLALAFVVLSSGALMVLMAWALNFCRQHFPGWRSKIREKSVQATQPYSPGMLVIFASFSIFLLVYVFSFGYLIPKWATDKGRARAEWIISNFISKERNTAELLKVKCVHMTWGKQGEETAREIYAYQIFCNDKLCKLFVPATKTFPTIYLDGIRSIVPRAEVPGVFKTCAADVAPPFKQYKSRPIL